MFPAPELPSLQMGAFLVFSKTSDRWQMLGSPEIGYQMQFHLRSEARVAAESFGFDWDEDLSDEVDRCSDWYREEVKRREKKRKDWIAANKKPEPVM